VARAELQERLWRAVLALEEPYRSAVILRHLDQLEPREIARRQGCSPEAARQRVARGLQQLRARLDGEYGGRERWWVALLPLALPAGGAQAALGAGGVLMSKWVALAVGLILFCAWWWGSGANGGRRAGAAEEASTAAVAMAVEAPPSAQDEVGREELQVPGATVAPPLAGALDERLLRGRVVDSAGAPVPGARVTLRRPELRGFSSLGLELDPRGEKVAETDTDQAGHFSFDVGPDRPFDVWAEKSGIGEAASAERFAGHTLELRLKSAFLIQGRVTRASDGRPVAKADVWVKRSRDHDILLRHSTTGGGRCSSMRRSSWIPATRSGWSGRTGRASRPCSG